MNKICKECGAKCCKGFFLDVHADEGMKKYLKYHGCIFTDNGVFIPLKCKFLTEKGKCLIYNSERKPKVCTEFKCKLLGGSAPIPPI